MTLFVHIVEAQTYAWGAMAFTLALGWRDVRKDAGSPARVAGWFALGALLMGCLAWAVREVVA